MILNCLARRLFLAALATLCFFPTINAVFVPQRDITVIGVWMEASPGDNSERYALQEKNAAGVYVNTDKFARVFFTKCFQKIREMKFNTVRPSNLPHYREDILTAFMTIAGQYKLWVILDPGEGHNLMKHTSKDLKDNKTQWKNYLQTRVINKYSHYSTLLGYSVIDEPSLYKCVDASGVNVTDNEKLARWNCIVNMLAELDPSHPDITVFCNPTWLSNAVNSYSSSYKVIAFDNYPFEWSIKSYQMGHLSTHPQKGELNWYYRYKMFKTAIIPVDYLPQISVVQAFKGAQCPWRFPLSDELKTCVYTSLAAGAKGIIYFLFMDVSPANENPTYGLVAPNFSPSSESKAIYDAVCKLNGEVEILSPVLKDLSSRNSSADLNWSDNSIILQGCYEKFDDLSIPYRTISKTTYYIIAHKNPNPKAASYNHTIELTSHLHFLTDIVTKVQYKPNTSRMAKIVVVPTKIMVLREDMITLNVNTPVSTSVWKKGSKYPITWTTNGVSSGTVTIQIFQNSTPSLIASNISYNASPFQYTIPASLAPGTYYIKITHPLATGKSENFKII